VKGWNKIFHANEIKKKVRTAILTSDKTEFKFTTVKKRHGRSFYNDKGVNSSKGNNNSKYIYAANIIALNYVK
jgi:hypothetical protein